MDRLIPFLQNKGIRYVTPKSPDYGDLRPVFIIDEETVPAVVARPGSMEDLASLVSYLKENEIPFSVRGGGHDMFGRSQCHNGVTVDMRGIAHVELSSDSRTARVGGGVISMDLLTKLQEKGVTVPHGATPMIGFVGWAIHGGYGMLSTKCGLGVDQIVGAKIVDARGRLRDADESILTVIRGAGGVVGVIAELTVKVYPIDQVFAGVIFYDSTDLSAAIRQYSEGYEKAAKEGISPSLSIERFVLTGPAGKTLAVFFVWSSSNIEEGQAWLSKVSSWAPVTLSTVAPTTIAEFNEGSIAVCPREAYGTMFSVNVKNLTLEVLDILGSQGVLQTMTPEAMFGVHEIRAECPVVEPFPSVFNMRESHFVIEIIPIASTAEGAEKAATWARGFYDALMKTDPANILGRYIPFTPTREIDLRQVYGDRLETLKKIKSEYDPENVFKHALVKP